MLFFLHIDLFVPPSTAPSSTFFCLPAYQITYHLNSSNSNSATVDVLNPSARQYTVAGLKPESVYVFRITAQTRKGWGEAAEALVVITEKRGERPVRGQGKQCVCVSVFLESGRNCSSEKKCLYAALENSASVSRDTTRCDFSKQE